MSTSVATPDAASPSTSRRGQLRALLRTTHPRQALAIAVVVGLLVALMGRPPREWLVSAAAVLVVQLALGLVDDLVDVTEDSQTQAAGKPLASGAVPRGNATYALAVLLLLAVPLSLQNGIVAGLVLLATFVVGVVHDRWLHRTPLSFVGWAASFALLTAFVSYGGWGREAEGSAPVTQFAVLAAVLGVLVHFLVALPDLVTDNRGTVRHLPLRIALRTGAPKLFAVTVALTVGVVAAMVWTALTAGIAR
ncbi:UbiA family prenyltransferase [Nocardioides aurantiacus]|uniref:4-hydroxybenzoate polyprenyltransferase n=1 Tax=Nocardioides aurantiacus TaxID=86796 RepID=A0A3N2CY87_9ACTN|nr:UbiA family prenyltransferase [Nocardioides aurantiacus]ROR92500.1 4-hydroxybenzoate polyprenyltransferase [Nocardioides aurantiacus]